LKELWKKISTSSHKLTASNAEHLVDFIANKMNKGWKGLEEAPTGSIKNRIHGVGLKLLSGVKPSEIFLKSISNEIKDVEVVFPSSLNARLVRRRLRHIAMRGTVLHKKYFYGSVTLLPLTSVFMVLPLPNIPFFWILFRTYSHWRARQGSEKLLELVSDSSAKPKSSTRPLVLVPSKELEKLVDDNGEDDDGLSNSSISDICETYKLNTLDALKYRNSF
jgi:hypothetical protein